MATRGTSGKSPVCVLSDGETEAFELDGIKPSCKLHKHISTANAFALTRGWQGDGSRQAARWVGPNQIVMILDQAWKPIYSGQMIVLQLVPV